MNDLTKFGSNNSASLARLSNHRQQAMMDLAIATKTAIDVQADVAAYGWQVLLESIEDARYQLYKFQKSPYAGDMDMDIIFQAWLRDFMAKTSLIDNYLGGKLQSILENMPTDAKPPSFLEEMRNRVFMFFFGRLPQEDDPVDSLLRLGSGAKKAFTDMAKDQLDKLPEYINRMKVR